MTIQILRTPDERFADLPDFAFQPLYVDDLPGYTGLRVAYIDEGPRNAEHLFLCLHGEPSWSYLYRRMIPVFLAAGGRVVAPDFLGFGRSDKPVDEQVYSFHFHRNLIIGLIERLGLSKITLVVQDWGGIIGLTLPVAPEMAGRISRLIVMNTMIATGEIPSEGFRQWRSFVAANPDLDVGGLLKRSAPHLTAAEVAAYDAPFPDIAYKAGVRAFPPLVMTDPGMAGVAESRAALLFWRNRWIGQSFMAIGAADPVLGLEVMARLRANIAGCPEPMIVAGGGHFVQEWGKDIAESALRAFATPPASGAP